MEMANSSLIYAHMHLCRERERDILKVKLNALTKMTLKPLAKKPRNINTQFNPVPGHFAVRTLLLHIYLMRMSQPCLLFVRTVVQSVRSFKRCIRDYGPIYYVCVCVDVDAFSTYDIDAMANG